jgi:hypothetical protein
MNRLAAALCDRAMANLEAAELSQWRRELLSPVEGPGPRDRGRHRA